MIERSSEGVFEHKYASGYWMEAPGHIVFL